MFCGFRPWRLKLLLVQVKANKVNLVLMQHQIFNSLRKWSKVTQNINLASFFMVKSKSMIDFKIAFVFKWIVFPETQSSHISQSEMWERKFFATWQESWENVHKLKADIKWTKLVWLPTAFEFRRHLLSLSVYGKIH